MTTEPPNGVPAHPAPDVERQAARGGLVTGISQVVRAVVNGAGIFILARALRPDDFGLVSMIVSVTGIIDLLKDFGLSSATIQRPHITHAQVNVMFWINVAVGLALTLLTAASAPLFVYVYGRPELFNIVLALSLSSVLGSIPLQQEALLRRELRFAPVAVNTVTSASLGMVAAMIAAHLGWGPWALVTQQLVRNVFRITGIWSASQWRPTRPRKANVREILHFGAHVSGFQVLNYFERNIDNALVGRFSGPQALGLYSKAYEIMRLPLDEVNRPMAAVALPALSRLVSAPDRYRTTFVTISRALTFVTVPVAALAYLTADWCIPIMLGKQWVGAVPIFRWLCLGLTIKPLLNTTIWLFISQGRSRELFRWGVLGAALALASFILGLRWGAAGVAACYTLLEIFVRAPILIYWVSRSGPVGVRDLISCLLPGWVCGGALVAGFMLCRHLVPLSGNMGLAVSAAAGIATVVLSMVITPWGRSAAKDGVNLWRSLKRPRQA